MNSRVASDGIVRLLICFVATLLCSTSWISSASAQSVQGMHRPLSTPKDIILTAEAVAGNGAVRVFDFRTGKLKHYFSEPTWQDGGAGRAVAIYPETGELWVQDGHKLFFRYSPAYVLQGVIDVDLGSLPNSTFLTGHGLLNLAVDTDSGGATWLYAVGTWKSAGYSFLLKVDPTTGACVSYLDLKATVSGFAACGVTVGPGPLGVGRFIYVSESHTNSQGRVLRVADLGVLGLVLDSVMVPAAGQQLGELAVLDDGTIIVGSTSQGQVFVSTASQSTWAVLPLCQGAISSYSGLDAGGSFLGTMSMVIGPTACSGSYQDWSVVRPFGFPILKTLDASAGGTFTTTAQRAALRW